VEIAAVSAAEAVQPTEALRVRAVGDRKERGAEEGANSAAAAEKAAEVDAGAGTGDRPRGPVRAAT
jgi:hypothetical protein